MQERDVERKLKERVEALGCMCLKFVSPGYTGVPDRMILLPGGEMFFVELKAPGKKERPRQKYVQQKLRDMGFTVLSSIDGDAGIKKVCALCESYMRPLKF
ncbi:MAG: VRR-NUC domain-containing protein [Eubacterium sp.]|nr:VRR-NUC domain-containing protein [Eubacterium sp.]